MNQERLAGVKVELVEQSVVRSQECFRDCGTFLERHDGRCRHRLSLVNADEFSVRAASNYAHHCVTDFPQRCLGSE
jgi:hypothetical protein